MSEIVKWNSAVFSHTRMHAFYIFFFLANMHQNISVYIGTHQPQILYQDVKCKLRLLSQRDNKISQVVDPQNSATDASCNSPAPLLISEVLLWLGCAGYSKEALQLAKRTMMGWRALHASVSWACSRTSGSFQRGGRGRLPVCRRGLRSIMRGALYKCYDPVLHFGFACAFACMGLHTTACR